MKPAHIVSGILLATVVAVAGPLPAAAQPATRDQAAQSAGGAPAVADARRLGEAFGAVARDVSPSVVSILVEARVQEQSLPFFFGGGGGPHLARGNGSGVIIRPDGYILTNRHVIADAVRIRVLLKDGRRFPGTVVGTDPAADLAVVRIAARGLPVASFADMDQVHVGDWVLAIGSPFALDYTVTAGVVSALGRGIGMNEIEDYVQTDASINPGNSGGPLVNLDGRIVGINTMIAGRGTGIGFAVPADLARTVTDQLIRDGRVRRAWIGISFQELTPELARYLQLRQPQGALVSGVVADGPAAHAGIEAGDVIVSLDGQPIAESRDLLRQVLQKPVGATVRLQLMREGRARTISLRTGERPSPQTAPQPPAPAAPTAHGSGLSLEPLTDALRSRIRGAPNRGVVITDVAEGSAADLAGLETLDVITQADRRPVSQPTHVLSALADGSALLLVHGREGGDHFVVLSLRN